MYEVILDQMIDDMQSFGMISTILISEDYYDTMSTREKAHLESFLYPDAIKWLIVTDRKEYWSFRYSHEPMVINSNDIFPMD